MKKLSLIILITLSVLLSVNKAIAQPFMGAVINWEYLGQDSFFIKVFYYHDCNSVDPPTEIILNLKCDATGTTLSSVNLPLVSTVDITPICSNSYSRCSNVSSTFPYGINKCTYQNIVKTKNAGNCCLLRLSVDFYEWPHSITTGPATQSVYLEAKLNRCQSTGDNSPEILNNPIIIVPTGKNYVFNFNATDSDGDSLTYELTPPLQAYNTPVTYLISFSYNKPLYFLNFPYNYSPFPRGFHLDTITGDLMFRPTAVQHTIMAVKIREYRNRNQIGEIMVEYPIIVISNTNNIPSISTTTYLKEVCAGSPVSFDLTTIDSDTTDTIKINWNNSLPNADWSLDSTNPKRPKANLVWTPNDSDVRDEPYTFIVFVEDNHCPLKGYYSKAFQIKVKPSISASHTVIDSGCGKYRFSAQTVKGNIETFNWYCKNNFYTNTTSFTYPFPKPGIYPYKLTINHPNSCPVSYYDTIITDTFMYVELPADTHICSNNKLLIKPQTYYGSMPLHYIWNNSNNDTLDYLSINPTRDTVINLKVIDALGCERTDQMKVFVYPLPVAEAGNDTAICMGNIIQLNASGGVSYEWSTGDTTASIIITPDSSFYYSVKVSNQYNCITKDSVYVKLNSFITDAGNDTTICMGETVKLKAEGGIIFKWNTGQTTNEITVKPDSSAYFSVEVSDSNNCTDTDSVLVNINQLPIANAGNDREICRGDTVILQASGGQKYLWNTGQTTNEITVKPVSSAYYSVEVIDANHCTDVDSVFVNVKQLPIANAGTDSEICIGKTVDLQASGGQSYIWSTGDTTSIITVNPIFSQHYVVKVVGSNDCYSFDTVFIKVNVLPVVDFNASPLNGNMPLTVQFDNLTTITEGNLAKYRWDFGDNDSSILFEPSHTFLSAGNYTVKLSSISDKGCIDSLERQNYISVITSIENNPEINEVKLIPNPAGNQFVVLSEISLISSIKIYNHTGSVLMNLQNINTREKIINSAIINNGLYLVEVRVENGRSYLLKLIIK
jgi:PKD repeat protein